MKTWVELKNEFENLEKNRNGENEKPEGTKNSKNTGRLQKGNRRGQYMNSVQ